MSLNKLILKESDGLKIRGHLKATVYRGDKHFVHHNDPNTINQRLLNAMARDMLAGASNTIGASGSNYHSNNNALSTSNNGEDGILVNIDNILYGFTITPSAPATDTIKLVGTLTGVTGTIALASDIQMGVDLIVQQGDYRIVWANPYNWTALVITAVDTLVLEWKIELKAG